MKKYWVYSMFLTLLTTVVLAEQPISVIVDGQLVIFGAVGPQSVRGRVLVPLRGVLERAGAIVEWSPSTREVVAQRGDRTVVLKIGSTTATVNGQPVLLDVPAMSMAGTTMVPLRFLGEALGAEVKWDSALRRIEINTSSTVVIPGDGRTTPQVELYAFTHNAKGWLLGGDTLQVTLVGTPGGTASFEIPGVLNQTRMEETSPGHYVGQWKVPANAKSISDATVLGLLQVGGKEKLIQAGNPVNIDATAPEVRNLLPEPDSQISQNRPSISAVIDDQAGSGIDTSKVAISIDGLDVTGDAVVTPTFVSYRPSTKLAAREHSVSLSISDRAGNNTKRTWKFSVTEAMGIIKSFTFKADASPAPGDIISARLEGAKGGSASFSFVDTAGNKIRTQPMQETSPGVYEGEYTVRKGDNLAGSSVVGSITIPSGEVFTQVAEGRIGGQSITPEKAVIKSPVEGATVKSPLTIIGTAAPRAQVRLVVEYATTVIIRIGGKLSEQVVEVSEKGEFQSEPINLGTVIKGKDTEYTLTATVISPDGKESEPTVVHFTRS